MVHATGALRAKPVRDAGTPVLVRVRAADDGSADTFTIEFLGAVEGTFDLLPLLETTDGRAPDAAALGDLRVEIFSQLPPVHGTDVFGLSAPGFDLRAHYTPVLGAIAAAWLAVPAIVLVRRWMRTPPPPPAPPAPPPSAAERLLAELHALDARLAQGESPDADARGRIELLLFRVLRERAPDLGGDRDAGGTPDPARDLARLRGLLALSYAPEGCFERCSRLAGLRGGIGGCARLRLCQARRALLDGRGDLLELRGRRR